jgi:hypothetical protein
MNRIEKLKSEGQFRYAGQLTRMAGDERSYGCHYGMRSTRDSDMQEFYAGFDEIDSAMASAHFENETGQFQNVVVNVQQGTIGFEHGFTCGYVLHRERNWNVGLRRHTYALTGKIEVIFPNGARGVYADWDHAKSAVRIAANQIWPTIR